MKFVAILIPFLYTTSSASKPIIRGRLRYSTRHNIENVGYCASTIFGILCMNFNLPGLYEESTPADYAGVSALMREGVDLIFRDVSRTTSVMFSVYGPLRLYDYSFETVWMNPTCRLSKSDAERVSDGLIILRRQITAHVFSAASMRIGALGDYQHPFSKLLVEGITEFQNCQLNVHLNHFILSQNFTNLSLFVSGVPQSKAIDTVVSYFNRNTLNDWISLPYDYSGSPIGISPTKASTTMGSMQMRVTLDYTGRISVRCKSPNKLIVLKVGDRNEVADLGVLRSVNWDNVSLLCIQLEATL